jgi:hypothetical protein
LEHTVGLATATAMNGSRETNALFYKVWKDKIPPKHIFRPSNMFEKK